MHLVWHSKFEILCLSLAWSLGGRARGAGGGVQAAQCRRTCIGQEARRNAVRRVAGAGRGEGAMLAAPAPSLHSVHLADAAFIYLS